MLRCGVIGEELGFIHRVIVILVYTLLVFIGLYRPASRVLENTTGRLTPIPVWLFSELRQHGSNGNIPNTGLPLPFIAPGISSLLQQLFIGMGSDVCWTSKKNGNH